MKSLLILPLFFCVIFLPAAPARETPAPSRFAAPAAQLADLVASFVERDEIVGAELLVIHDRTPILHRAFGLKDREKKQPMTLNSYFAVRSMTKPFTGLAAQILIDEGKLALNAPVAKYLPSFDNEKSRAITVRHLLTHRGGFPFIWPMHKPLSEFAGGLRELADLAGERGPAEVPESGFVYSDIGSDVLGAVIAEVSGQKLEDFIAERILRPLQLRETFPEAEAVTESRRDNVPTRYLGVAGYWTRYWSATDAPIYPFLKGSGGLFSTARDYARFLQTWMDGRAGKTTGVVSADAISRALTPSSTGIPLSIGFPDLEVAYGQMWMLYHAKDAPTQIMAFGHGGSDGTFAYAFPKENLIVCYLTQTRGNETSGRFEAALSHLFLKPDAQAFTRLVEPPAAKGLQEFTGLYARDNKANSLAAIVELNGALTFEFPGRMLLRLRPTEERDRWVPERMPNDAVVFRREEGRVVGLAVHREGKVDEAARFRPDPSLPSVEELVALRTLAVPTGAFATLLPLRISSVMEQNGTRYPVTEIYDQAGRSLTEIDFGAMGKMRVWIAGERVWREVPGQPVTELRGLERAEELNSSLRMLMGDWSRSFHEVIVLAREMLEGREVLRVRTVPRDGVAAMRTVSADDGNVLAESSISLVPGAGFQPIQRRFTDHRTVEKVSFPFAQTFSMQGVKIAITVTKIEPRAQIDPALMTPPTEPARTK